MNEKKRFRGALSRLDAFEKSRAGKCLLIVANGPSSEKISSDWVRDFVSLGGEVMGMNWAHLNPTLSTIPLTLYLSADRRMIEESRNSHLLRSYLNEQTQLAAFVPEIRLEAWEKALPNVMFTPFCRYFVRYLRPPWWGLNPTRPKAFTAQSGLHALQIATWMAYERIYIVGFDNSYFQDFRKNAENATIKEVPHAGGGTQVSTSGTDTATYLETQARLFRDYWLFSKKPIFNLDLDSATDAFPKVRRDLVLGGMRREQYQK